MTSFTIDLPAESVAQLHQAAASRGEAPADYAARAVLEALQTDEGSRVDWRARLAALVADFRAGVAQAAAEGEDVSPQALEAVITEAREERRRERRAKHAASRR